MPRHNAGARSHSKPKSEPNADGCTYAQWMSQVNEQVLRVAGLSVYDLGDFTSYDFWASDMSPVEAAQHVLEENDFPFDDGAF